MHFCIFSPVLKRENFSGFDTLCNFFDSLYRKTGSKIRADPLFKKKKMFSKFLFIRKPSARIFDPVFRYKLPKKLQSDSENLCKTGLKLSGTEKHKNRQKMHSALKKRPATHHSPAWTLQKRCEPPRPQGNQSDNKTVAQIPLGARGAWSHSENPWRAFSLRCAMVFDTFEPRSRLGRWLPRAAFCEQDSSKFCEKFCEKNEKKPEKKWKKAAEKCNTEVLQRVTN